MNTQKLKTSFNIMVDKIVEYGGKISNQKHFAAIRDGFGAFLPFTIVGSLGLMISAVFLDPGGLLAYIFTGGNQGGEAWEQMYFYVGPIFNGIFDATVGFFALFISFLLGYYLMGSYKGNQLYGGSIGLIGFLLLQPSRANPDNALAFFGATGIIYAMIAGLTAPTLFYYIYSKWDLKIKMPDGVPPAITNAFALLIPITVTLFIFGMIQPIWGAIMYASGPGKTINEFSFYYLNVTFNYVVEGSGIESEATLDLQIIQGTDLFAMIEYASNNGLTSWSEVANQFDDIYGDGYSQSILENAILATNEAWESVSNIVINSSVTDAGNLLKDSEAVINPEWYYFINGLNKILVSPLQNGSQELWFIWVYLMMMTTLFFFGIHGPNTLSPIASLYTAAAIQNVETFATIMEMPDMTINSAFDYAFNNELLWTFTDQIQTYYGTMGGTGATLALVIAVAMFSKTPKTKEINKLASGPAIFNINEPIIFGFPIMLNIVYAIPFIFVMPIDGIISAALINIGFLNPQVFLVPWTTPAPLGALLVTMDWKAPIWVFILITFTFFCYLPFVIMDAKAQAKENLNYLGNEEYDKLKSNKNALFEKLMNKEISKDELNKTKNELSIVKKELSIMINKQIDLSQLEIQNKEGNKYFSKGIEIINKYYDILNDEEKINPDKKKELKKARSDINKAIKQFNKYQKPLNDISDREERFENQKLELEEILKEKNLDFDTKISNTENKKKIDKFKEAKSNLEKSVNNSIKKSEKKLNKFKEKKLEKAKKAENKIEIK